GASLLDIGTGIALDRLVLPQLRSEPIAASDHAGRPSGPGPSGALDEPDAGTGTGNGGGAREAPGGGDEAPSPKTTGAPTRSPKPAKTKTAPAAKDDPPRTGPTLSPGSTGPENAVVALTNAERAKAGCDALRVDRRLVTAARAHSADMAANDYFDHDSPNGDSPWMRMREAGYAGPGAENIARGYATAAAVVDGWMASPGHRANILNCGLRAIGVGMAAGSDGPLWTQDFGWT
ncbi:CAP domain-containing protein, partial [Actinomadura napierensis]|uniref:CAP domain-containing protein n=1 Tax=Actinomadura napierensis TaxID=267854 RepID=UPI0031DF8DDC